MRPSTGQDSCRRPARVIVANHDGDHHVIGGERTLITPGMRAAFIAVAVRTHPQSRGANGISMLLPEGAPRA